MAGYIEDRWLNKNPNPETGERRTERWGTGKRYRVAGIAGVRDRSFTRLQDAKKWQSDADSRSRAQEFTDPRRGDIALKDYIETHWLPHRTDPPTTRHTLGSHIRCHIIPLLGAMPLRLIDAEQLRGFRSALLSRVGPTTAEQIWGHLSNILRSAVADKRILRNPCSEHADLRPKSVPSGKVKAWGRGTVDAMRENIQARYRLAVDLGVGLGLRQGEAFGLGENDIGDDVVRIDRQLQWDDRHRPYFTLPKGGKTREVPLPSNLRARILSALEAFPAVTCTLPWSDPEPPTTPLETKLRRPVTVPLLLTTTRSNRIDPDRFNDLSWKKALSAIGMIEEREPRIRIHRKGWKQRIPVYEVSRENMFHVLRHTYASVQLEAGESIVSLSRWMGHSDIKTTLDYYAHFMPTAGAKGLDVMNAWFDSSG